MKKANVRLMSADLKRVVVLAADEAVKRQHNSLNHEHFLLAILMTDNPDATKWLFDENLNPGVLKNAVQMELSTWHDDRSVIGITDEHNNVDLPFSKEMANIFTDELSGSRDRLTSPLDILIRMLQAPTESIEKVLAELRRDAKG